MDKSRSRMQHIQTVQVQDHLDAKVKQQVAVDSKTLTSSQSEPVHSQRSTMNRLSWSGGEHPTRTGLRVSINTETSAPGRGVVAGGRGRSVGGLMDSVVEREHIDAMNSDNYAYEDISNKGIGSGSNDDNHNDTSSTDNINITSNHTSHCNSTIDTDTEEDTARETTRKT